MFWKPRGNRDEDIIVFGIQSEFDRVLCVRFGIVDDDTFILVNILHYICMCLNEKITRAKTFFHEKARNRVGNPSGLRRVVQLVT